ncbi:MAG TPA: S9 family peptidase, partial [Nitrolancea sp.]|nr:S9 family peptidase [Nitrolancea sp.]
PARDGLVIQGWLLRPPGAAEGARLPLIANVHGGPTARWGPTFHGTWHDWAQSLAGAGYAVLLPNPRGSTGRGAAFTSANRSDLGGKDFEDVLAGVDYLIERGIADPERLGIGGWSYGGFLTAWAVGQTDRFKAAVAGAAVTNWPSKVGTTDIRTGNEKNFPGPLHEQPDAFWERSPVRYLGRISTPTLVLHGEADPRVPPGQGYELYQGLREMGVPTDFITYPRQKHAFHEKAFQQDLLQRVVGWFQRWIPVEQ